MKKRAKGTNFDRSHLFTIKRMAGLIRKSTGLKHNIALNIAAMSCGYRHYQHARGVPSWRMMFPGLPKSMFLDDGSELANSAFLLALKRHSVNPIYRSMP